MRYRTRRLIFAAFVVTFMVSAPAVVLYTGGYRLNWHTGEIVQTGLISASTLPRAADITLDGRMVGRTPTVVDAILEGEHTVRLEKDGFISWERAVPVRPRTTTFLEGIPLFRDAEAVVQRVMFIRAAVVSPNLTVVAREEAGWIEVWTLSDQGTDERLLARIPSAEAKAPTLELHAFGGLLRITTDTATLFVRTDTGAAISFPLAAHATFDPSSDERVFARDEDGLFVTELADGTRRSFPPLISAAMSNGNGFIVIETTKIGANISRIDGTDLTTLALIPEGEWQFERAPSGLVLVHEQANDRLMLADAHGGDRPILLSAPASQWAWSPDERTLAWNGEGTEVNTYDLETHSSETVTRSSLPITHLTWLPNSAAILFSDSLGIHAIEAENRFGRASYMLVSGSVDSFAPDTRGRELRFARTNDIDLGVYTRVLQ